MSEQHLISNLVRRHACHGRVRWLGVRSQRKADVISQGQVDVTDCGLVGDHRAKPGKRAVTLIQHEHFAVMASLLGCERILPERLRRNVVVSGINLLGLRNRTFRIGEVVLEGTGLCAPCSRMELEFGDGGYSAVRGHGGICASVVEGGTISVGDSVEPL